MIIHNLDEIYRLTAQLTEIPLYKVKHAIKEGEFNFLKDWLHEPEKPSVMLPEFGRFELHLSSITRLIKYKWIPILRYRQTKEGVAKFRFLWRLRKKILEHIINRRLKKRHN